MLEHFWLTKNNLNCLIVSASDQSNWTAKYNFLTPIVQQKLGAVVAFASLARGVSASKLEYVLSHGIDVEPPSASIFADFLQKALEYGDQSEQLILLFDRKLLLPTWIEIPINTSQIEIDRLRLTYPTLLETNDKKGYWLSRRDITDLRMGTGYESQYSYWCPDDPNKALNCLVYWTSMSIDEAIKKFDTI